ncbi:EVE domain-containing protein [Vulcanisaeta thermophila]|uniref:EVE domain-containing protein n=1 Tax=Vulcanisaeta thermophila TaxID=867917 RepID=UPI000852D4BB|nr:EVE domain-containing protein [Vulcanisaeta thermophila]
MVHYWIFVTKPGNLKICLEECVFGVDKDKYGITALDLIRAGDLFFFYVRTSKGNELSACGRSFVGPFKVNGKPEEKPTHPAVKKWNPPDKYTIIIPFERASNQIIAVKVEKVIKNLYFITNKGKGGRGGWQDHVQFSIISIIEDDYNTLLNAKAKNLNNKCMKSISKVMGSC